MMLLLIVPTNRQVLFAAVEHIVGSHLGGQGWNLGLVMWDFVMDKSGAGAGFLRELRFPLPIYIPYASP
jgi:hypothetical protein